MGIPEMKVLTGTMLSLLLSAVSVYPAIARPVSTESNQLLSQVYNSEIVRGVITRINGESVTLELPSGNTYQISVDSDDITEMNLRPGMEIVANLNRGNIARGVRVVGDNMMTAAQPLRGTIRTIEGNLVTIEMPDGSTRRITIRPEDITRLDLETGMQISLMLNDESIASDVRVVQVSTTPTNSTNVSTTRREEVTIERNTVETIPAPPPPVVRTEVEETTTVTQPVETDFAPVRALW